MARSKRVLAAALSGLLVLANAFACAPAPAARPATPAAIAAAPMANSAVAASAPTGGAEAAAAPTLATTPAVDINAAAIPIANYAPLFIGRERGHFQELGLNVQLVNIANVNESLAALAQGQIQVGSCSNSVGCFNAFQRRMEFKIVADLKSNGKTEKSIPSSGLVVRKDLWDSGTIRGPQDLVGREVWTIAGEGSGQHATAAHWLRRNGVDPRSVEWRLIPSPDLMAGMANGAIEAGSQLEPFLTVGTTRGIHHLLASNEEMHPQARSIYVMYWTGIDRLGPQVGERFMVAYLRAAREYLNAFEYGVNLDAVLDILIAETAIKDPAIYRQIKYSWIDPDGAIERADLEVDATLYHELGLLPTAVDLRDAFDDRYRQFAVQYLGPYTPPR